MERLIGGFSSLLVVIFLHGSSLASDYRTQASLAENIPKMVDQYFKSLSAELSEFGKPRHIEAASWSRELAGELF